MGQSRRMWDAGHYRRFQFLHGMRLIQPTVQTEPILWSWFSPSDARREHGQRFLCRTAASSVPLPVPFVPAVPTIVDHAGCQASTHADTYECEKHRNFDSSEIFHGTFLPRPSGKRLAISFCSCGERAAIVPALLVIWAGQERRVRLGNYAASHAPAIFGEKISVATAERP
jgi:hypothetical protein